MKNILIIGCGLLGSSLLRRIDKKKIAKKIFIYEKSKSNVAKIKKLKLPGVIVKNLKEGVINSDLIIFCTPMSEYKKIILKINKDLMFHLMNVQKLTIRRTAKLPPVFLRNMHKYMTVKSCIFCSKLQLSDDHHFVNKKGACTY